MHNKTLFPSLLILVFISLVGCSKPTQDNNKSTTSPLKSSNNPTTPITSPVPLCPKGEATDTKYIYRENPDRCEGIKLRATISSGFRLISLVTGNTGSIPPTDKKLTLRIHRGADSSKPNVRLLSMEKQYQLDNLSLSDNASFFTFSWPSYILNKESIPLKSLRALASVNLGSQFVYVPVILGQPSGQYEIVMYSSQLVKITTFEISRNNQIVFRSPRNTPQRGEVVFNWDGRNAPAGRYQLRLVAELEQYGRPPETVNRQIIFEHNPNWLK